MANNLSSKDKIKKKLEENIIKEKNKPKKQEGLHESKLIINENIRKLVNYTQDDFDLTDLLDADLSLDNQQFSIASYLFNKKTSQKYLKAMKYYILKDIIDKQTIANKNLLQIINTLIERVEKLESKIDELKK